MRDVKYMKYITKDDVKRNKNSIFVFGDNDIRSGFGGQAREMRGEPNAIGIRVKKSPSMDSSSFYTDDEYNININKIAEDLLRLNQVSQGKTIIFPEDGIGTGRAMLDQTAPMTFTYLSNNLYAMFGIQNGDPNKLAQIRKDIRRVPEDKFKIKRNDEFIKVGDYVEFGMGIVRKTGTIVDVFKDEEGNITKYTIRNDEDNKNYLVDKNSRIRKALKLRKRKIISSKVKSKKKIIRRTPIKRCKCKTIKRRK